MAPALSLGWVPKQPMACPLPVSPTLAFLLPTSSAMASTPQSSKPETQVSVPPPPGLVSVQVLSSLPPAPAPPRPFLCLCPYFLAFLLALSQALCSELFTHCLVNSSALLRGGHNFCPHLAHMESALREVKALAQENTAG